ncbi:acidic phospholipase A2 PA-3-like [Scyliorhinus torazame]|uniref:acidic phospholipase A2 PA-3-like n=1 Tax=Scyliorhinus torazame TaxID=75743 RepID=UPI003B595245
MESPKLTAILIVLGAICIPAQGFAVQGRSVVNFKNVVVCASPNVPNQRYMDYGCFCGYGGNGNQPLDDLDRCCQVHDDCYGEAESSLGCKPLFTPYSTHCENEVPQCSDTILTRLACGTKVCNCDVAAALCFRKHSHSYNPQYYDYDQSLCKTV